MFKCLLDIKQVVGYVGLRFKRVVWVLYIKFEVFGIYMVFKVMRLDDIIQGVSLNRKEQRTIKD